MFAWLLLLHSKFLWYRKCKAHNKSKNQITWMNSRDSEIVYGAKIYQDLTVKSSSISIIMIWMICSYMVPNWTWINHKFILCINPVVIRMSHLISSDKLCHHHDQTHTLTHNHIHSSFPLQWHLFEELFAQLCKYLLSCSRRHHCSCSGRCDVNLITQSKIRAWSRLRG